MTEQWLDVDVWSATVAANDVTFSSAVHRTVNEWSSREGYGATTWRCHCHWEGRVETAWRIESQTDGETFQRLVESLGDIPGVRMIHVERTRRDVTWFDTEDPKRLY